VIARESYEMTAWLSRLIIAGAITAAARPAFADGPNFGDLLARAEAQAAAGHRSAPSGDNMTETVSAMIPLVSSATPEQLAELSALLTRDATRLPHSAAGSEAVSEPAKPAVAATVEPDRAVEQPAVPAVTSEPDRPVEQPAASSSAMSEPDRSVERPTPPAARFKLDRPAERPAASAAAWEPDRPVERPTAPAATLEPDRPAERPAVSVARSEPDRPVERPASPAKRFEPDRPVSRPGVPTATSQPDRAVARPVVPAATLEPDRRATRPGVQAMATEPERASTKRSASVARRPSPRATDLLARGQEAEQLGDVSGARRFYASAVQLGSATAARNLGRLYDPVFLSRTALGGIDPDLGQARHWYELAVAMGDPDAAPLLEALALR
jgi:hypothetical protein